MLKDTLTPKGTRKPHISDGMKLYTIGMGFNPQRVRWDTPPPADWKDTIPEGIRKDPVFDKYKNAGEAFTGLVEAQKFLGREHLPVPKDDNDTDAYNLISTRLGLPKDGDGYVIPTDLNIPKELPLDEARMKDFKKVAHGLGILPKQFAGLYKWHMNDMIGAFNKHSEGITLASEESEVALRKDWGATYTQNIALAKKVFSQFADEKAYAEFEKGAGNNPVYLKLFANIGKVLSEDQLTGKPVGLSMSPDEAQVEIKKMEGDLKGPLYDSAHPQHQEYVDKKNRLYKFVIGD